MRVLVVLGSRLRLDGQGRLRDGPLLRRVTACAKAFHDARGAQEFAAVVASGGRRWGDSVEADVIARELARRGLPRASIVRERLSMTTRENALYVAEALLRRGIAAATVAVVTSEWHLPRAIMLFRAAGVDATGVPAGDPERGWRQRSWRWGKERVLAWLQGLQIG